MSYYQHHLYSNGFTGGQYTSPQYNGYVDPRQMPQGAANGYSTFNPNVYRANRNFSPYNQPQNAINDPRHNQHAQQIFYHPAPFQHDQSHVSQQQQPVISQQRRASPPAVQGKQQQQPPPPTQKQQLGPQQPPKQQAYAVAIPAPSPSPAVSVNDGFVHMSEIQRQTIPTPPLDYQTLLLSLAEEYLAAAYELGAIADIAPDSSERQEYYKLIATGLGCLDALLKQFKLAPNREANVRLRYATLLYEETENAMEAEEALSKGISICDRYKYFDLKYNMQHLLARVLFTKTAKAAFKFLDQIIADAKAYQHIAWEYAFRFLKVSLHLELSSPHHLAAALAQLRTITSLARDHNDKAILAMATTMEALVYLREPGEPGGFEQAQRALASVRSLQLDPAVANNTQLTILISFVDISCHLQRFDPLQAISSMQNMQNALAQIVDGDKDSSDAALAVPISKSNIPPSNIKNGIVKRNDDGSFVLIFNWMPSEDIYNIGFLMSGIAMAHKNTTDGHKSEQMFSQGVQRQQWAQSASKRGPKSITLAIRQQSWREEMAYYMRLYHAFSLASRTCWAAADHQITEIKKLHYPWPEIPNDHFLITRYLQGSIAQGTGDLLRAFSIYKSVINNISLTDQYPNAKQSPSKLRNLTQLDRELYVLSTLNILQIIRNPDHPQHSQFDLLLAEIAPYCTQSFNRGITSAYHLISAACPASSKIIATKQSLHSALESAKAVSNNKLVCVILNIMSWKFFSGVIVEQAEKSAKAGQILAKKSGDTLWISVAAGVLAATLEAAGRIDEAAQARAEGEKYAKELPQKIQEVMYQVPNEDKMISETGFRNETA